MSAGSHSVREKWTSSWSEGPPKQDLGASDPLFLAECAVVLFSGDKVDQLREMMQYSTAVLVLEWEGVEKGRVCVLVLRL